MSYGVNRGGDMIGIFFPKPLKSDKNSVKTESDTY